jgi:hypothetical protein
VAIWKGGAMMENITLCFIGLVLGNFIYHGFMGDINRAFDKNLSLTVFWCFVVFYYLKDKGDE